MKITKEQLRRLIKEELEQMEEADMEFDYEKRQFVDRADLEQPVKPVGGEKSDPLRDAVVEFVTTINKLGLV